MNNPTFQEALDKMRELGGRVVIEGDIATCEDHVRMIFEKRGWAADSPASETKASKKGKNATEPKEG